MLSEARKNEIEEEEKLRDKLKRKKGFKKRSGCLVLIVILLVLWCVSSLAINGNGTNDKNDAGPNLPVNNTENAIATQANAVKTYQLGQSFNYVGDFLNKRFDWLITKSEFRKLDKYTPTCGYTRDTFTSKNGKYYVITIGGKNQGNEEFNMNLTVTINLILVSKDGKKYSQNDIDMLASYKTCTLGINSDTANPGSSAAHVAVFDVPEQEYKVCDQYMKNVCIDGIK